MHATLSTSTPTTAMSDDAPAAADTSAFVQKAQAAAQALSLILGTDLLSDALASPDNPAAALLRDAAVAREVSRRLRRPGSGAGDDNLCRWLYDTFQSTDPALQLLVLRFIPAVAGVYLSRAVTRKPLAGFEAFLLALYAHETVARGGEPVTVVLPNVNTTSSVYHEAPAAAAATKPAPAKNNKAGSGSGSVAGADVEEPTIALLSPALEPHGTVRSTKRARIVGVALELYYSKIAQMPAASKLEFLEFCVAWSGQEKILQVAPDAVAEVEEEEKPSDGDGGEEGGSGEEECGEKGGRIPIPWELFQPVLRIVGHCLMGPMLGCEELKEAALVAVRCLHARALHDTSPRATLATRSLLRLASMGPEVVWETTAGSSAAGGSPKSEAARISV